MCDFFVEDFDVVLVVVDFNDGFVWFVIVCK